MGEGARGRGRAARAVAARPARITENAAVVNADARLVRLEVVRRKKAYVVGRDDWTAVSLSQIDGRVHPGVFTGTSGARHFEIEAVTEALKPVPDARVGDVLMARIQRLYDIAITSTAECDQSVGTTVEPVAVDDRSIVSLALGEAARDEFREIEIAGLVLSEEREPRRRFALLPDDPQITARDGLHASVEGC